MKSNLFRQMTLLLLTLTILLTSGVSNLTPAAKAATAASGINNGALYYIKSPHSNLYLDINGGAGNRTIQWNFHGGNNQQFRLVYLNSGYYRIYSNWFSDYVLDVANGSNFDGATVLAYPSQGSINQEWEIIRNSNGTYRILSRCSNSVRGLAVQNASYSPGAPIFQWQCHNNSNDTWILEPVQSSGGGGTATPNFTAQLTSRVIPASSKLLGTNVEKGVGIIRDATPVYLNTYRVNVSCGTRSFSGYTPNVTMLSGGTIITKSSIVMTQNSPPYEGFFTLAIETHGSVQDKFQVSLNSPFTGSRILYYTPSSDFAVYQRLFNLTYYITCRESDYSGTTSTYINSLGRQFNSNFISAVNMNGTGYANNGKYIKYDSGTYSYVSQPTGATGKPCVVDKTIAVDHDYIPLKIQGGERLATVYIDGVGYRRSEDSGGSGVKLYRIDVYYGTGKPKTEPSWNRQNKTVYYYGNNINMW